MGVIIESFFDTGTDKACDKCKRHKEAKNPFLKYRGEGKKEILIVIDSPTKGDDEKGKILSGETRNALSEMMKLLGYSLERDFWITPAVKCWGDKSPTKAVCEKCRIKLEKDIEKLDPKGVFLMGSEAIKTLLGEHLDKSSEASMSGLKIPYMGRNIYPMYSVEFLLKKQKDKNFTSYFKSILKEGIIQCLPREGHTIPVGLPINPYDYVTPLVKYQDVINFLNRIYDFEGSFTIDYETTGLNPYVKGHKITSVGICLEGENAHSFPLMYQNHWSKKELEVIIGHLRSILMLPLFKIAHNSPFETKWSKKILDVDTVIDWCTMTMQHLIDTRQNVTGLKYQAFVRWGISGYEDDSKKYIEAPEGTPFNKMEYMPLEKQLYYVGSDAFLTMKLFLEQEQELAHNENGSKFFNKGVQTLGALTDNGIWVDTSWYNDQEKILSKEIKELEEELNESQEVIKHMNNFGLDHWDYTSSDQVSELLINTLGLTTDNKTTGGKASCDEKALSKMNHWIPEHILKLRKLLKLRDTYLAQFMREICDDKLHPDFTLHIARSLRSSSRSPNFQNLPKRDERAKMVVRKGLKPSKGNKLCEVDFSGIEVSTSVLYHKDPIFLHYLESDTADMHRDNAADIWMTPSKNVSKKARFYAKNCWTFPQFYGDYYASCAIGLWENRFEKLEDGVTCVENLKKKGVTTFKQFVDHLKKCEDILWNVRFKVYTEWKNKIQLFYQKHGYIETYFGFRYTGYLDKKQLGNYPIQGTAFHIMLWCLIRLQSIAKRDNWKTKIIGQIHDSMVFDMDPAEESMVIKTIKQVCEREVVDRFDWITTQFRVDVEMSEVDGSFAELSEWEGYEETV